MKAHTKQSIPSVPTVEVNGQQVPIFTGAPAEFPLAVVDLNVLKALASLLPKADLRKIKSDLADKLYGAETMDLYIQVLEEEVAFHKTVNMITLYAPEKKENVDYAEIAQPIKREY